MKKNFRLIGVPMDLGQDHRGVDMGPSAIRYAGLADVLTRLGCIVDDSGDLPVPQRYGLAKIDSHCLVAAVHHGCELVYKAACKTVQDGKYPIFMGGDHAIAIGSISGLTCNQPIGVLWLDAHCDSNIPETSPSGNIHGMPLAVLLGHGDEKLVRVGDRGAKLKPEDVVLIGVRSSDSDEKQLLKNLGVRIFTMRDIDERGMGAVMQDALQHLRHRKCLHVSLDMDCLDPQVAPGVGTPSIGGLTYREAQLAMEIVAETGKCCSMDLVEINPILDQSNKTARMAVALVESLAGKTIL
jgi:arginase